MFSAYGDEPLAVGDLVATGAQMLQEEDNRQKQFTPLAPRVCAGLNQRSVWEFVSQIVGVIDIYGRR